MECILEVWLLSLNMILKFTYDLFIYYYLLFIFIALSESLPVSLSIFLWMDNLIKAAKNILARVFVWTQALIFLDCVPRNGVSGL